MGGRQNLRGIGETPATEAGRLSVPSLLVTVALFGTLLLAACASGVTQNAPERQTANQTPNPTPVVSANTMRQLAGLSSADVIALFGEPDFRRTEPPAELWQYRSADCVLDIFLYSDKGSYHVLHSETRQRSFAQAGPGRCEDGAPGFGRNVRQSLL
ncbi:MAG TPA: hypothetical protein VET85_10530 [Stellaceae bacterium]|nr:hypothetical protein [Stellaceae bacterium]